MAVILVVLSFYQDMYHTGRLWTECSGYAPASGRPIDKDKNHQCAAGIAFLQNVWDLGLRLRRQERSVEDFYYRGLARSVCLLQTESTSCMCVCRLLVPPRGL